MHEFVVPRSIPIVLPIRCYSFTAYGLKPVASLGLSDYLGTIEKI